MAWPNYAPPPLPPPANPYPTAAKMLEQIISRCDGWLTTHPEDPPGTPLPPNPDDIPPSERQRWQRIRDCAYMDLHVNAHHDLTVYVNCPSGTPANGNPFDLPWGHVKECRLRVYKAAPSMDDLMWAIVYIDHMGGGGVPGHPLTIQPEQQVITGLWPDIGIGAPTPTTARRYLDAILSHSVGQLRQGTSLALRNEYTLLVLEAFLDRSNVKHGKLRNFVKTNGKAVAPGSLKVACGHVRDAFEILNGDVVDTPQVRAARRLVNHS